MSAATDRENMVERIRHYIGTKIPNATGLRLDAVERIAVGWSHETWLFDAHWIQDDEPKSQGLCLRRDPGNALLRHFSDLGTQFRVLQCLDGTALPTPRPYWYETDPSILDKWNRKCVRRFPRTLPLFSRDWNARLGRLCG